MRVREIKNRKSKQQKIPRSRKSKQITFFVLIVDLNLSNLKNPNKKFRKSKKSI
jgi:hypothetical protein